jgi:signal transduction histidine kinase
MNVILGYAKMLQEEYGPDERFDNIIAAGERVSAITESSLEFTKAGSISATEPIELKQIALEAWQTVETKDAKLNQIGSIRFHADRPLILQLLENLFRNAIDHVGDDCTITVGSLEDGFYVQDDGHGLPEDVIDSVLMNDFSTNGSMGLGLSIVDAVVEAHGGELEMGLSPEGGARFEIVGISISPDKSTSEE